MSCNRPVFVSDPPLLGPSNDKNRKLRKYVYKELGKAKELVSIDSPYFIMTHGSDEFVKNILEKGVEVELLTNGIYSTDALPVASVFNFYLDDWIEAGLKPTVFGGKREEDTVWLLDRVKSTRWGTHSKSIVFDNDTAMIGTFNFDLGRLFIQLKFHFFVMIQKSLPKIQEITSTSE